MNESQEPRKVSLDDLTEMEENGLVAVDAGGGVFDVYRATGEVDPFASERDDSQLGEFVESVEVDYLEGLN